MPQMREIELFLEYLGLAGIIGILAFITWTKMLLGAVVTIVGAFFPSRNSDKATGTGTIKWSQFNVAFKGSLRIGVIIAGIVLIVGLL
jgi:hypothetical protein